jgi:hypothetical protein
MSISRPSKVACQVNEWKVTVVKVGIGLLAAVCVVALLTSAVEQVRDSADRAH